MSKVVLSLQLHSRFILAAAFLALLLAGLPALIAPRGHGAQGAPLLTVSAGGPYSGATGIPISMTASVISGTTTSPVFAWNFGDGASGIGPSVSHSYASTTSYHVTVSVIDSVSGASGFASTTATVGAGGSGGALTVTAFGPYSGTVGVPVTMYATATDASPQYTWIFGDGATSGGQSVTHAYSTATTYTVTVYVRDSISGATGSTSTTATIGGSGSTGALQVSAGGPYSGTPGVPLTMSATATDANPSFSWNFGDGTNGYGQTVSHTYAATTTYSITVTVSDLGTGLTGTATTTANTSGSASTYGYCNGTYELLSLCSSLASGYQECNGTVIPNTSVCPYGTNTASACTGSLLLSNPACGYTGAYSSTCAYSTACGSVNPYSAGYQGSSTCAFSTTCGSANPYSTGYQGYSPYGSTGGYSGTSTGPVASAPAIATTLLGVSPNPLTGQGFNGVPATTAAAAASPVTTAAVSPAPTGTSVTYQTGWNLVAGLPGVALSNVAAGPLAFQPAQDSYQSVDPSQAVSGQGYWVNFSAPTTVNVAATGTQPAPVPIPAGSFVLLGDSGGSALTVSGADAVWTYSPTSGSYTQTTTLLPGQAGWAYSTAGATASFSITGAATSGGSS